MADTAPERSEQSQLGACNEFHTVFGFIIGLMMTLVGVKYQGSGTTLFKEHSLVTFLFIMIVLVYAIALLKLTLEATTHHQNANSIPFYYTYIFVFSGTVACELLLYVLVTSFWWFLIISSFLFVFATHVPKYDRLNKVFCRSPNSSRAAEQQVDDGHDQLSLYDQEEHCLGLTNRMHRIFQHIFGRFNNSSAPTTNHQDEGGGDIQITFNNIVV